MLPLMVSLIVEVVVVDPLVAVATVEPQEVPVSSSLMAEWSLHQQQVRQL
jgi:hypothetical protein